MPPTMLRDSTLCCTISTRTATTGLRSKLPGPAWSGRVCSIDCGVQRLPERNPVERLAPHRTRVTFAHSGENDDVRTHRSYTIAKRSASPTAAADWLVRRHHDRNGRDRWRGYFH